MKRFGLIGYPLGHSFSAGYFASKFEREGIANASYQNFELASIETFPDLIEQYPDLVGLNVTIPYKQTIIPYLDEVDAAAKAIGAINTIAFHNGRTKGYNTDYIGFRDSIKGLLQSHHTKALVLGTGGSSKAVVYALGEMGIETRLVSRKPQEGELTYADINEQVLNDYPLIINTTPLGMHPATEDAPTIPYQFLTPKHLLYDLIYNPAETLFLKQGKAQGAIIKNGLKMLELQAEASWRIWNKQV